MTTHYHMYEPHFGHFELSEGQLIEAVRDRVFSDHAVVMPLDESAQMRVAVERLAQKALAHLQETQQRAAEYRDLQVRVDERHREQDALAQFYQSMNQPLVDLSGR